MEILSRIMEILQRSIYVAFLTADCMCHEFSRPIILAISVLILVFLSVTHIRFLKLFLGKKKRAGDTRLNTVHSLVLSLFPY